MSAEDLAPPGARTSTNAMLKNINYIWDRHYNGWRRLWWLYPDMHYNGWRPLWWLYPEYGPIPRTVWESRLADHTDAWKQTYAEVGENGSRHCGILSRYNYVKIYPSKTTLSVLVHGSSGIVTLISWLLMFGQVGSQAISSHETGYYRQVFIPRIKVKIRTVS